MYAVIRTGGKQYTVREGDTLDVESMPGEAGEQVELAEVLMIGEVGDGTDITVGRPLVDGAKVVAEVVEHGKGKKIIVFKYKSKTRARKKTGHRQHFTRVMIDDILAAGQEPKPKVAKAPAEAEAGAPAEPKRRGRRKPAASAEPEAAAPEAVEASVAGEPEATAEAQAAADAVESAAPAAEEPSPAADEKPKRGRRKAE